MPIHIVKQGECLTQLAQANGFADYRAIYDHPENAGLRKLRSNPHVLSQGDKVSIPEQQPTTYSRATGAIHPFTVQRPKRILHLKLLDASGAPLAGKPYELNVGSQTLTGSIGADGVLKTEVPMDAASAELAVENRVLSLQIGYLTPVEGCPDNGVAGVQARLLNLGFDPGPIDGVLGPRTEAAIRAFQQAHPPLKIDGVCGPKTKDKLLEVHGC